MAPALHGIDNGRECQHLVVGERPKISPELNSCLAALLCLGYHFREVFVTVGRGFDVSATRITGAVHGEHMVLIGTGQLVERCSWW